MELQAQLDDKKVMLEVDDAARDWLADNGYDKAMGARPMALLIKDKLRKPLAEAVLFGELSKSGGRVEVTVENGEVVLHIEELTPA